MLNHIQGSILPLSRPFLFRMSDRNGEDNRNEGEGTPPPAPTPEIIPLELPIFRTEATQEGENDDGTESHSIDDSPIDLDPAAASQYYQMPANPAMSYYAQYGMPAVSTPGQRYASPSGAQTAFFPSYPPLRHPYAEAFEASTQAGGDFHEQSGHLRAPSDEDIADLQGIGSLRSSSSDGEPMQRYSPLPRTYNVARMPPNPPPPDAADSQFTMALEPFFNVDGASNLFIPPQPAHSSWAYYRANTPIQHSRYPLASPPTPPAVATERTQEGESDLDQKPAASSSPRTDAKKSKGRAKTVPKKKSKPKKHRTRASRNSNGSSSSSSPGGASTQGFKHIQPDDDELKDLTTDRATQALLNWYQRLRELYAFREEYGHTEVPQKFPKNRELGVWVNKQRMEMKAYIEGNKSSLTPKKISRLESAGFLWAKPKGVAAWEKKYEELQQYIADNGDAHVPTKYPGNRALGRWVSTQRNMFKKYHAGQHFNNLSPEEIQRRIQLLNNVEFSWSMVPSSGSDENKEDDSHEDDINGEDAI